MNEEPSRPDEGGGQPVSPWWSEFGRVCALSPHLDDAVLGCAALLARCAGARVVTVMAGVPAQGPAPPWDRACGFASGVQAMHARRREDAAALAQLGATPRHLEFLDAQYGAPPEGGALQAALAAEVAGADTVLMPMGLFHSDHDLVHRAALAVWRAAPARQRWYAYEEALYRRKPGLLQQRLGWLRGRGVCATPLPALPVDVPAKASAVRHYASQLKGLGLRERDGDPAAAESYWSLLAAEAV